MSTLPRASRVPAAAAPLAVVLLLAGCAGSSGPSWDHLPLGTGLSVAPAGASTAAPSLTTLAARTVDQRGGRRAVLYGLSGRFTAIRNSAGTQLAGGGIGAILYVDLDANELQRAIVFGDPGPGVEPPVFGATEIAESPIYDTSSRDLTDRPRRVVVTVSGLFTGVDAGRAGTIAGSRNTGAVAVLDLFDPGVVNVLCLESSANAEEPVSFGVPQGDLEGYRATVSGTGPFDRAADLRGLYRAEPGGALQALFDLRSGAVEQFTVLGGPVPAES